MRTTENYYVTTKFEETGEWAYVMAYGRDGKPDWPVHRTFDTERATLFLKDLIKKELTRKQAARKSIGADDKVMKELEEAYGHLEIDEKELFSMMKRPSVLFFVAQQPTLNSATNDYLKTLLNDPSFEYVYGSIERHSYKRNNKTYIISFK